MTAALAPPPTRTGLRTVLAEVHVLLDGLQDGVVQEPLGSSERAAVVRDLARLRARVDGLRLSVMAGARSAAREAGAASTGAWVASLTHADPAAAARESRLAESLSSRTATRDALATGRISQDHAAVIATADRHLPETVTREERSRVEQHLLTRAETVSPQRLRRLAKRALEAVEPDETVVDAHEDALVRSEEDAAYARTRLTLHDNHDGTVTGHFTLPRLHGDLLAKVLHALTSPRRAALGANAAHAGTLDERRDPAHARGLAFAELLEHLPADRLHDKSAFTLLVTLDHDTLLTKVRAATTETDDLVSAGQVRRLACNAGLLPAVLGGGSRLLDLGRTRRLFSTSQRVALALRHTHCAAEGCERPYAWCELHHRRPWSTGGTTDLDQAVPLCWFHHRRIHDPAYRHRWSDGSVLFTRMRT